MILLQSQLGDITGTVTGATQTIQDFTGDYSILFIGLILIIATIIIIHILKNIIANSIIGIVAWAIIVFLIGIDLPLIPSLIVSAIFGLAGIGVILVLKFLGLPI